jgi:hypothetical protein
MIAFTVYDVEIRDEKIGVTALAKSRVLVREKSVYRLSRRSADNFFTSVEMIGILAVAKERVYLISIGQAGIREEINFTRKSYIAV